MALGSVGGRDVIVAGQGSDGGQVKVFDAVTLDTLAAVLPFGPDDRFGISVAFLGDGVAVPEPGTLALLGGLAAVCIRRPRS